MAVTATATAMPTKLCSSGSDYRRLRAANRVMSSTKLAIQIPLGFSSGTTPKGSFFVRAQGPLREEKEEEDSSLTTTNNTAFTSKEDLDYLWKLAAGSIVGAALIKYGSVVFPDITRPNLTEALFIILSPVIISVLLLISQSRKEKPS